MENAPALEVGLNLYTAQGQLVCQVIGLGEENEDCLDAQNIVVVCGKTLRELTATHKSC